MAEATKGLELSIKKKNYTLQAYHNNEFQNLKEEHLFSKGAPCPCLCHDRFLIASPPSASESHSCLLSGIKSDCTETISMSIENNYVCQEYRVIAEVRCY